MMSRTMILVAAGCAVIQSSARPHPAPVESSGTAGQKPKAQAEWPGRRVEGITARLLDEPEGSTYSTEFRIKKDQLEKVIKALSPPVTFIQGANDPPVGEDFERGSIRVRYADKSEDKIIYYAAGKNPLIFIINGRLYMRGRHGNPNMRKEHSEIYGIDEEHIDESGALDGLLKRGAEKGSGADLGDDDIGS